MKAQLDKIPTEFEKDVNRAKTQSDLDTIRLKYLGRRNGLLTKTAANIKNLSVSDRSGIGTQIKHLRNKITKTLQEKSQKFSAKKTKSKLDLTTSGRKINIGGLHPITTVIEDIKDIFRYLGFTWTDGPEAESDTYNFQKLNMPPNHPARDAQQTYYLSEDILLRTHTSNMQVRYLESHKPPLRALFPGRCYRRDMPDATHLPSFYQVEGLLVDSKSTMTDLLGTLKFFAKNFFGEKTKIRVYGHHFPYTEPSIEVEVLHAKKGWIEVLGAGMVHPNVLKNGGLDPNKYRGWAFGMGPDRLVMLKYGIDDIRLLYNSDLRFLNQF
jgi:phenylalanyl-tRNA synthetase alpha chain